MARGGYREGAGRKPGQTTKLNEQARKAAAEGGIMPLDYLLALLRDEGNDKAIRFDAAVAAAELVAVSAAAVVELAVAAELVAAERQELLAVLDQLAK